MSRRRTQTSLKDVARAAHVSTATVSRVLNGTARVESATRDAVLRATAQLHYTPNLHARTLAAGSSRTLGVIVSNLDNPFFLDVYHRLEAEAQWRGYAVLVANTGYDPARLAASVELMRGLRVAGIAAIISEQVPAELARLMERDMPVVFYDVGRSGQHTSKLRVDYAAGMRQIVQHLHSLGHRRFAFVEHHAALGPLHSRRKAFEQTIKERDANAHYMVAAEEDSLQGGWRAGRALLSQKTKLTAIVCVNDVMAAGVLRALHEHGIRVPEDVSVTGFDNVTFAEYVRPGLTTVDIPRHEIGRLAVELLLQKPTGSARDMVLAPTLIVRGSTGPVARTRASKQRA